MVLVIFCKSWDAESSNSKLSNFLMQGNMFLRAENHAHKTIICCTLYILIHKIYIYALDILTEDVCREV